MPHDHPPLVALISAVDTAITPIHTAFDEHYPTAQLWNIIDDRLLSDAAAHGAVTTALHRRMQRLIDHVVEGGADAVLLTCSMYASVAHEKATGASIPILGPDDALFQAVTASGYRRITVVSSAPGPLADSIARLRRMVDSDVTVDGALAAEAAGPARHGNLDLITQSICAAVTSTATAPDAVVLGQYSLTPVAPRIETATGIATLAGPDHAVRNLRARLEAAVPS
ncbi:hypothetical protein [Rhodococcoides kyotonense]|uniref:Asp/Glu/hydantoin racemase n=1 Tax=Rhodococcoides kyotonense TaxID=398843 RepID=A0A239MX73_9NOCA|nr:hypothetical protein [Rhodococcus kyotonensis]SNT47316.1 hypothetical protein SAMN05421642_12430 [Rhodococcus kyotonensis]